MAARFDPATLQPNYYHGPKQLHVQFIETLAVCDFRTFILAGIVPQVSAKLIRAQMLREKFRRLKGTSPSPLPKFELFINICWSLSPLSAVRFCLSIEEEGRRRLRRRRTRKNRLP